MEKINTDYKRRIWTIEAKLFNMRKPWLSSFKAIFVSGVVYRALSNPAEVDLIVKLCRDLAKILHVESVGIITPYRQQKGEIQSRLMDEWV